MTQMCPRGRISVPDGGAYASSTRLLKGGAISKLIDPKEQFTSTLKKYNLNSYLYANRKSAIDGILKWFDSAASVSVTDLTSTPSSFLSP